MKICLIVPYSVHSNNENLPNIYPNIKLYVNVQNYEVVYEILTKSKAIEEIDEILKKGYDYYWNFLLAHQIENLNYEEEIKAIEYLESFGVPIIGPSSKFLRLSKLDLEVRTEKLNLHVPKWTLVSETDFQSLSFPVGIKHRNANSTLNVVCWTLDQLYAELENLKLTYQKSELLVQVLIEGEKVSCMVIETPEGIKALNPIIYDSRECCPNSKLKLLEETNTNSEVESFKNYKVMSKSDPNFKVIQKTAIESFIALGISGCGYAKIQMKIVQGEKTFIFGVDHSPEIFGQDGKNENDDVINETYPGGHAALFETIISSKKRFHYVNTYYKDFSSSYDSQAVNIGKTQYELWKKTISTYDFNGKILDLACGTGIIGKLIHEKFPMAQITGVDISKEMTAYATNYHKIHIGYLEDFIFECNKEIENFDHIVACGVFQFIEHKVFKTVMELCFSLAKSSITLTIEDLPESYLENIKIVNASNAIVMYNNVPTLNSINIPSDWKQEFQDSEFLWTSPKTGENIHGITVRYKKK